MTALADLSDVVNRLTGGNSGTPEHVFYHYSGRAGGAAGVTVAGRYTSFYRFEKYPGGAGTYPTTSAVPDNANNGGMFQTDPGGGRQKWLLGASGVSSLGGTYMIYDRLVHQGGLSGTTTTAQTTNLPTTALTRYSGTESVGNQIWIEIHTQIGTTATTVTASYTNQAGTASRTTKAVAIGGTGLREVDRFIPLPLQDGDTGVRSVENVDLDVSTGTAGAFGVVIVRPLFQAVIPGPGLGFYKNFITSPSGPLEIKTDACLCMAHMAVGTTPPVVFGSLHMIEA